MLDIPGINKERVRHYGKPYQQLAAQARGNYREMMQNDRRPLDPNRQEVILIDSEDEDDPDQSYEAANCEPADQGPADDVDTTDEDSGWHSQGTRSAYFPQNPAVSDFNARSKSLI